MRHYRSPWRDAEMDLLAETAAKFVAAEIVPNFDRFEEQQRPDRDLWNQAGALGLLCCSVPVRYGGGGGTFAHDLVVFGEHARAGDTGFGTGNAVHSGVVAHYLLAYGTEEQKQRWLPRMASGELVGTIAMTEPGAGSDLRAITTRAVRDADRYLISGAKTFISNGATANLVIVVVKTDPTAGARGISLVVVEPAEVDGFTRGRVLAKLGMHGQDTAELFFDEVAVPLGHRLGEEGSGFAMLTEQLRQERLLVGVTAAGAMERALAETIAYVKVRRAFGQALFDLQHVRFELAECATLVHAGRVFVDDAIVRHLRGELDASTASMVKWWLAELQNQVVDRCLQLFGGYGYMREYLISRLYADARAQKIYGGANEIMKELIARNL